MVKNRVILCNCQNYIHLFFGLFSDQFILYEDGYGKIVGRLKDMIIRGGENIYPKEIEDFLNTHPDIIEAQVSLKIEFLQTILRFEEETFYNRKIFSFADHWS